MTAPDPRERGQALILMTISFLALLAFVGLVTDTGSLYNAFGQLRRGVDAAALASAVQFRETGDVRVLTDIAEETLQVNGIDRVTATVYTCDNDGDLINDTPFNPSDPGASYTSELGDTPPNIDQQQFYDEFRTYCPSGEGVSRKFVWVYAQAPSPVYFLQLFGVQAVDLTAYAISEAATLDIVLVLDTSESMAIQQCDADGSGPHLDCSDIDSQAATYNRNVNYCGEPGTLLEDCDAGNYASYCNDELADLGAANPADPDENGINACYPFYLVKDAAAGFINRINFPYDQVAIVTFDGVRFDCDPTDTHYNPTADCPPLWSGLSTDPNPTLPPPSARVWTVDGQAFTSNREVALDLVDLDPAFSPLRVYEKDQSYKTLDVIEPIDCGDECMDFELLGGPPVTYGDLDRFCGGDPSLPIAQRGPANFGEWMGGAPNPFTNEQVADYVLRYCVHSNVGGGMRVASEILRRARANSVRVVIFLADGVTNLSDLPPIVDMSYGSGFCQGPNDADGTYPEGWFLVRPLCADNSILTRYCSDDAGSSTCPPTNYGPAGNITNVIYDPPLTLPNYYNVEDYARDWADAAALQVNQGCIQCNPNEPLGGSTVIYSIGMGPGVTNQSDSVSDDNATRTSGAAMLRYFAAVGDDGDRTTDPCWGVNVDRQCGNYYYSPDAAGLARIFDTIAEKVFFRISQ